MDLIGALVAAAIAIALVAGSLILRAASANKYEIRAIDLSLAIIPIVVWLLATGQLKRLTFAGVEFETAQAFLQASSTSIDKQVQPMGGSTINDVVHLTEIATKGGVEQIPELLAKKTEAIRFTLGASYYGPVIQQYLESLMAASYLQYVILEHSDGKLFGAISARELIGYLRSQGGDIYEKFAGYMQRNDAEAKIWLQQLPGFWSGDKAIKPGASKRQTLESMEKWQADSVPVVNADGRFIGMINRSQLSASLMLEIARKLESQQ